MNTQCFLPYRGEVVLLNEQGASDVIVADSTLSHLCREVAV